MTSRAGVGSRIQSAAGLSADRVARGAVLVGLYLVVAVVFLPGAMVPDTLDLCYQAISGRFTDWHAPALAALWGLVFVPPVWVFLLTWGLTLVAVHLITSRWLRPWVAVAATVGICLFPPTVGWIGHIGKDQTFAAAFLLAIALLGRASTERRDRARRAILAGAVLCCWFAIAARRNAVLPVAAVLLVTWPVPSTIFGHELRWSIVRRFVAVGAVLVALVGSLFAFTALFVQPATVNAEQSTYLFDLTGISMETGEMLVPDGIFPPGTTLADVEPFYRVDRGDYFFFGAGTPVNPFMEPDKVERLRDAWASAVKEHPLAYLNTRVGYTRALLGLSSPHPFGSMYDPGSRPETWSNPCPLPEHEFPGLHRSVGDGLTSLERSNVVRSWVFVVVLIAATVAAGLRTVAEARALLLAGLLSLAGLAVVGISPTFRYSWFTALCALVAVALAARRIPVLGRGQLPDPPNDPGRGVPVIADATPEHPDALDRQE